MVSWILPAELNQPTPRKVRTRWAYRIVLLLGGAVIFLELIPFAAPLATYSRFERLASDPWVHFFAAGYRSDPVGHLLSFCTILSAAISIYSPYSRERRLLRWGSATAAEIVSEVAERALGGKTRITCQFTDQTGQIVRGVRSNFPSKYDKGAKSVALRAKLLERPTVLYDPADSRKNMIYPGVTATCE